MENDLALGDVYFSPSFIPEKMNFVVVILSAIAAYFILKVFKNNTSMASKNIPDSVSQWYDKVNFYSVLAGVPADIAMSVLWVESAGNPEAVGSAGERGLFQLKQIAVDDVRINSGKDFNDFAINADINIQAGIEFLALQYKRTRNWPDAIKAYNQGFKGMNDNPELAAVYLEKVNEKRRVFS